ncbi:MAG: glycosyltransferase family 1 protein [Xanthobacteraceae bacterium]
MPFSGIGRYIVGIAQALATRGHRIVLYLPAPPHRTVPTIDWADIVRTSTATSLVTRLIWTQTTLPAQARRDGLDLFWGPAHRLPWASIDSVPRVITIHDLVWRHAADTMRWRTYLGEALLMRRSVAQADLVLVDSNATGADLRSLLPHLTAQVGTVYPGHGAPPPADAPADDDDYLLFVGTLEPRKNLKRLLGAWQSLPSECTRRTRLLIVGAKGWGGKKDSDMSAFSDDPSIVLKGFVSESELNTLYAGARGLVMPSLYEGFGFPIIEAQARGVPVLASNVSSMPEIAGPDAILVNPSSTSSIRGGLATLLTLDPADRARRQRAIENARRFTWEKAAADAERLFVDLIHQTKAADARPARL